MNRVLAAAGIALIAALGLIELAYWVGSRLAQDETVPGACAVLVLGYPSEPDGGVHPVQRLRVEAGVAAYRTHECSRVVLSGGAVRNEHVEAATMARVARELGVPANHLVIEDRARSTWENVGCGLRHLRGYERIYIASDSLHAYRGLRYLCRQEPGLCANATAVGGYEPFSLLWWKAPAALHELRAWIRDVAIYERNPASNDATCPG